MLKFINCNDILKYFLILAIDYTNLTCSNSVNKMCFYLKQIKNSFSSFSHESFLFEQANPAQKRTARMKKRYANMYILTSLQ